MKEFNSSENVISTTQTTALLAEPAIITTNFNALPTQERQQHVQNAAANIFVTPATSTAANVVAANQTPTTIVTSNLRLKQRLEEEFEVQRELARQQQDFDLKEVIDDEKQAQMTHTRERVKDFQQAARPIANKINAPTKSNKRKRNRNKTSHKARITDRFSPSEGVAAGIFSRQKYNNAASDIVQTYVTANGYQYTEPTSVAPPALPTIQTANNANDNNAGVMPAIATDAATYGAADVFPDTLHFEAVPQTDHMQHLLGYETNKNYPTPPPGWMEEHPEHAHPLNHNDFNFDAYDNFPHYHDHYPEFIYNEHHHDIMTTTMPTFITTSTAPPVSPTTRRVKKYGFFFISRKLWYTPLYFMIFYFFYVLYLLLQSIPRYVVNLPNHYQKRRSLTDWTEPNEVYVHYLTMSVLEEIECFKRKYML